MNFKIIFCISLYVPIYVSFDVQTLKPFDLRQINDSYVEVNYSDTFYIGNFSEVKKVVLFGYEREHFWKQTYAEASLIYTEIEFDKKGILTQPVHEEKKLLAKLDLCEEVDLTLRIGNDNDYVDSQVYKNLVDFKSVDENDINSLICLRDKNNLDLSYSDSENFCLHKNSRA